MSTLQLPLFQVESLHFCFLGEGVVKSPDYGKLTSVTGVFVNSSVKIQGYIRHGIFISWLVRLKTCCSLSTTLKLYTDTHRHGSRLVWWSCVRKPTALVFFTRVINVVFHHMVQDKEERFRILFSFHEYSVLLKRTGFSHGMYEYNCSVPQWLDFQQHLRCNLRKECAAGEDETGCSYESHICGPGLITAAGSCYKLLHLSGSSIFHLELTWYHARDLCRRQGGYMASLNTPEEWTSVLGILERTNYVTLYAGLGYLKVYNHKIYRDILIWADDTVMHYGSLKQTFWGEHFRCTVFSWNLQSLQTRKCSLHDEVSDNFETLCEMKSKSSPGLAAMSVTLPNVTSHLSLVSVIECPLGHNTHTFQACDVHCACWGRDSGSTYSCDAPLMSRPPSFECDNGLENVPYSLVCDFRQDCSDGSDEEFCVFPPCALDPFPCGNNQCIQYDRQCDGTEDCTNGADEQVCTEGIFRDVARGLLPYGIRRHSSGGYLNVYTGYHCEDTEFRCHAIDLCMPLYLRCNGINDCPGHEDELNCGTCPGFYRCRGSSICLHPVSMCDRLPDCPQHDDERFCDLFCPHHCTCYALSAYCQHRFSALDISDLRFLEARGSRMTLADLINKTFLIHLGLSGCGLRYLENIGLPNLRHLDVSDNLLTAITFTFLHQFPNLRELLLDGNPLNSVLRENEIKAKRPFSLITSLQLSRTSMKCIDVDILTSFPKLRVLNFSDSKVERISGDGLGFLTELSTMDMRQNPLMVIPPKLIRDLNKLQAVFADNYKLCCPAILPEGFNPIHCHAPSDEISSCDALLGSTTYRVMLSVFAALALIGNLGSYTYRVIINTSLGDLGFGVFVTHLSVSDFLMGVHLAVIGVADRVYLGKYLWADTTWKSSTVCSVAGFLALLSSQVSAFIICLITLDRFLVLRFPFSQLRFHQRSAHVASGVAWTVGVILAATPLLPMTSHWKFYNQNGICLPLIISHRQVKQQSYSFNVMIALNLVLFLSIVAGQTCICHRVRTISMTGAETRTVPEEDAAMARRLVTVALSNCVCWISIGVLGLLASSSTLVPGDISVTVFIVALPANAAFNPFLYAFNISLERRRQENKERIRRIVTATRQGNRAATSLSSN